MSIDCTTYTLEGHVIWLSTTVKETIIKETTTIIIIIMGKNKNV